MSDNDTQCSGNASAPCSRGCVEGVLKAVARKIMEKLADSITNVIAEACVDTVCECCCNGGTSPEPEPEMEEYRISAPMTSNAGANGMVPMYSSQASDGLHLAWKVFQENSSTANGDSWSSLDELPGKPQYIGLTMPEMHMISRLDIFSHLTGVCRPKSVRLMGLDEQSQWTALTDVLELADPGNRAIAQAIVIPVAKRIKVSAFRLDVFSSYPTVTRVNISRLRIYAVKPV